MEMVHHETRSKASKISREDFISGMPENVITNIMDRLPLKDAVGTCILSRSWRFNWTFLTKLEFDHYFFSDMTYHDKHFDKTTISRLIYHLKGAVSNFVLHITDYFKLGDEDIHYWLMFLSRKGGLKELTIINWLERPVKLPTHLFSCLELKHLELRNCILSPPPFFHGFPKLLSLDLWKVRFQNCKCGELIAQCPLLETVEILSIKPRGEVKLVEISKLKNVKILCLSLCLLDNTTMVRLSSVFQRMSLLLKLQGLELHFGKCKFLAEDLGQNPVSTTFPCLKTLKLWEMDFSSHTMLSCAFGMLFGCANLQTLEIIATYENDVPLPAIFPPDVDCNTMGQLQLRKVVLDDIKGWENEVCLIKYMLACSPMLKSLAILHNKSNDVNEKYMLARKLLNLHRASPTAQISI